jgi:hypothetical protein
MMALEALLCAMSAQQAASAEDLVTVGMRQSAFENGYSAIEAALSEVRGNLLGWLSVYESAN